jgi:beta-glucosidase
MAIADRPWLDPSLPAERRADLLLAAMTLEEKVGQLCQYVAMPERFDTGNPDEQVGYDVDMRRKEELVRAGRVGSFIKVPGWQEADRLQRAAEATRLGIPLLLGTDAIHGHAMDLPAATVYPTPIGLAATFDEGLVREVAAATARELRATGYHWTFSPNVDVTRDPRWGRTGETFGEDPFLVGALGAAMVRGYQGHDLSGEDAVLACAKHLAGGGVPENGRNGAPAEVSTRTLEEVLLPPFRRAVEAGVATVMPAHNELEGVPCHADRRLLQDRLRGAWGFRGFVVSDWNDVERLHSVHRVAGTRREAARLALVAGMDMHMHGSWFEGEVLALVRDGALPAARVDEAARRILLAKLRLGLFERRRVDPTRAAAAVLAPAHRALALEAARRALVLLRNEGGALPLRGAGSLLVTGPGADDQSPLGDWARRQPRENVVTVLDGLRALAPAGLRVEHLACGPIRALDDARLAEAARRARTADACVVVVGDCSLREDADRTTGENVDRASLDLPGRQVELVRAVLAAGKPTVVVLVNGAPISGDWMEDVPALLEAWEAGMAAGTAVAEVLYGLQSPSGRLPITVPRSAGHLRSHAGQRPSAFHRGRYSGGLPATPRFPFGHGLSYARFEYRDLRVPAELEAGAPLPVSLELENMGPMTAEEVVLVYLQDLFASVTRPAQELAAFRRVALRPGERARVELTIEPRALTLLDADLAPRIEPGEFRVVVGEERLAATVRVR